MWGYGALFCLGWRCYLTLYPFEYSTGAKLYSCPFRLWMVELHQGWTAGIGRLPFLLFVRGFPVLWRHVHHVLWKTSCFLQATHFIMGSPPSQGYILCCYQEPRHKNAIPYLHRMELWRCVGMINLLSERLCATYRHARAYPFMHVLKRN